MNWIRHLSHRSQALRRLCLVGVWVATLALSGQVHAHSLVTSAHSVSLDAQGRLYATMSFGLIQRDSDALSARWICPEAFESSGQALDRAVVAQQDSVWLLDDGQLMRSDDAGCSWTKASLPAGAGEPVEVSATDKELWVRTQGPSGLLLRSGGAWSQVALPTGTELTSLYAGPSAGALWATAQQQQPVSLVTSDAGGTWTTSPLPKTGNADVKYIALTRHTDNSDWMALKISAGMGLDQLWRSQDAGVSWEAMFAPKPGQDIAEAVWLADEASGTLLVGSMSAGIWRSVDGAQSFKLIEGAPRVGCLRILAGKVYGCSDEFINGAALMVSADLGASWGPALCFGSVGESASCADKVCAAGWAAVKETHGLGLAPACDAPVIPDADVDAGVNPVDAAGADGGALLQQPDVSGGGGVVAKRDGCSAQPRGAPSGLLWLLLCALSLYLRRATPTRPTEKRSQT